MTLMVLVVGKHLIVQQELPHNQNKHLFSKNSFSTSHFLFRLRREAANLDVFFFLDFGHFLVLLET